MRFYKMLINNFPKYIFWSYNKNADLPDDIIIKQVAIYGELEDIIKLSNFYTKKNIMKVLNSLQNKNAKRINFIKKVIL